MRLSTLAKNYTLIGKNCEINYISTSINDIREKCLFFLLNENNLVEDLKEIIAKGVSAIVCSKKINVKIPQIVVDDVRDALSKISAIFYDFNKLNLKIVGVIGTNGKTTTATLLASFLRASGKKVGTICTQKAVYLDRVIKTDMTTPDPPLLFYIFKEFAQMGAEIIIMEVSAHAIYFKKTDAIKFSHLIYTNCTQDHLDFFITMEKYSSVKESYLNNNHADKIIVNSDDEIGLRVMNKGAISYGLNNPADVFAIDINHYDGYISMIVNAFDYIEKINLNMIGLFNVYNFLGCVAVAMDFGISLAQIKSYAKNGIKIDGRCELIAEFNGGKIYLDYAHTPDGLERMLKAFRDNVSGKVFCLFGCGGNRDREKRCKMGEVAGKFADFTIITTDNPRYEEPYQIISEIEKGLRGNTREYITIQDRKQAIGYAMSLLKKGDVLILAGKGDENYQEVMGTKHDYSDRDIVCEVLNKKYVL